MGKRTVELIVSLAVTVDVDEWCNAYEITPGQVRADVEQSIIQSIRDYQEIVSVESTL